MTDKSLERIARTSAFNRPVNVRVPAEVAFDLDKVQQIQKDILGRLGCLSCCSGWDIRYVVENEFIVDRDLNVRAGGEVAPGV